MRGVEICRRAAVRSDPGTNVFEIGTLLLPSIRPALLFPSPGNDDVHPIFKIESVGGGERREARMMQATKRAFALSWRAHACPLGNNRATVRQMLAA